MKASHIKKILLIIHTLSTHTKMDNKCVGYIEPLIAIFGKVGVFMQRDIYVKGYLRQEIFI